MVMTDLGKICRGKVLTVDASCLELTAGVTPLVVWSATEFDAI